LIDRHRVPVRAMTPELPQELKIQLALAIAEGESAATWAREKHVPRSTAYRWAADHQVRRVVQSCRRRSFQRALGQMTLPKARKSYQIIPFRPTHRTPSRRVSALCIFFRHRQIRSGRPNFGGPEPVVIGCTRKRPGAPEEVHRLPVSHFPRHGTRPRRSSPVFSQASEVSHVGTNRDAAGQG
jgi:hypothetical protein